MCGVAVPTVCMIVNEVCTAIVEDLWDEFVASFLPNTNDEFMDRLSEFGSEWQFPYAFSAIDGSHLPSRCPAGGAESMKQYFNFQNKGFYSIVLMALVDAKYRFIWTSIGAPGNTHDSTYFQSTDLWGKICAGEIIPSISPILDAIEIPPLILGDGAFSMRSWIIEPHGEAVLTEERRYFNFRHSRARLVTEGAFELLKSRFRVLHRRCESNKETVKLMGLACVVLQNICIVQGDLVPRNYDLSIDQTSNKRRCQDEVRDLLDLTDSCQKHFDITGQVAAMY